MEEIEASISRPSPTSEKTNSKAIRGVCRQFCFASSWGCLTKTAIDGSKFKAVNNRDRILTSAKLKRRMEEIEASISRFWLRSMRLIDRFLAPPRQTLPAWKIKSPSSNRR